MDNFRIEVISEGRDHFARALSFFFDHCPGGKAVGYRVSKEKGLILYWKETEKALPFPYEMNLTDAIGFVWGWLEKADYGPQPDHDGDNGKGFRVYNEDWCRVDSEWKAFVAIEPVWAAYGK